MPKKKTKRNYHMCMTRMPDGLMRCDYCGERGTDNGLRMTECSYVYETCTACGGCDESNECRPDCPAMIGLLSELASDTKIYPIGF